MIRISTLAALSLSALLAACTAPMAGVPSSISSTLAPATVGPVTIGIVAINDFHGALEPPKQSVFVGSRLAPETAVPAGGAAYMASAIDSIRAKYPSHLTVSAGDLIGASSLVSSLYLDEPTIEAWNRIGLDFNAVGNHEFDGGRAELLRKQTGGCTQTTVRAPCQLEKFRGAQFPFLAANTLYPDGRTLFAPSALRFFGSGKRRVGVGLIGVTLKGTGELVSTDRLDGLRFADEADTVNALVPGLKARGADAVVLLIHQGDYTSGTPDPNGCLDLHGALQKILPRLDPRVDIVVSGHTHWAYVCDLAQADPTHPFLLTSAGVFGELVTDIRLDIDPVAHKVVARSAHNVIVQSESYVASRGPVATTDAFPRFVPRPDIAAYVARYVAAAKDYTTRPAGKLAGIATRPQGDASRAAGTLGNLIADAQLGATTGAGAQIAFMNPFGVRAPHVLQPAADGTVTFGQIYAVQPFNNELITKSYTGAQLKALLEQDFSGADPTSILAPSQGFRYSFDLSRVEGDRIVAMTLNDQPIRPEASYRVTVNSFLANGGDSYSVFNQGTDPVIGIRDIDALEAWLKAIPPRPVPADDRTVDLTPGGSTTLKRADAAVSKQ